MRTFSSSLFIAASCASLFTSLHANASTAAGAPPIVHMPPSDLDRDFGETLKGERKGGKAKEGLLSGIVQGLFRRISGPPKNDQRSLGEKGEGENAPLLPDSFFQKEVAEPSDDPLPLLHRANKEQQEEDTQPSPSPTLAPENEETEREQEREPMKPTAMPPAFSNVTDAKRESAGSFSEIRMDHTEEQETERRLAHQAGLGTNEAVWSNKGLADHDLDKGEGALMREVEELTGLGASGGGEKLAAVAGKGASMFDTHEALKTNIAVALKGADVKVTDKREKSKCGSAVGKARDDLISGIQHDCQTTEIDLTGLKGAYNEVKHLMENHLAFWLARKASAHKMMERLMDQFFVTDLEYKVSILEDPLIREHFGLYGEEEGVPNPSDIASLKRDADRLSGLVCGSDATCAQSEEQFRAWMEARKTLFRTPTAEFDPVSRGPRAGKVPREFSDYTFSYPEKVGGGSVSGFVQEEPSISSSSPQDNQQGPEEAAENGLSSSSTQISSQTSEGEGRDNQPAETQEDRERTRQQHQALVQTLSSAQQQMKDLKMHQKIISKRERDSTSAHSPPPVSVLPSEEEAQLIQSFAQNSGAPLAPSSPTDREEAEERLEPSNSQSGNAEEQRGGPGLLESIVSPHLFDSLSESA